MSPRTQKTIAVLQMKGGVGKTTLAVHIAGALSEAAGSAVILADHDPGRHAVQWVQRANEGLGFRASDPLGAIRLARDAAFVVIDTMARAAPSEVEAICEAADFIVVPTTPERLSMEGLGATLAAMADCGLTTSRYGVALTMVPPEGRPACEEIRDLLTRQGIPVLDQVLRRFAAYRKAAEQGCLVKDARRSPDSPRRDQRAAIAWSEIRRLVWSLPIGNS